MVTELLLRGLRIQGRIALLQSRARSAALGNDLARLLPLRGKLLECCFVAELEGGNGL